MIYLDYSADTPTDERVLEVYCNAVREYPANPNSAHSEGRKAKTAVDAAMEKTAALLGVKPSEIIFTSGASEANNLAVKGIAFSRRRHGKHIISTGLEHSSVSGALTFLQEQGWEIDLVNILEDGRIDTAHFKRLLRENTVLAAICTVDSELGSVQPIDEIADILKDYPNCALHTDATQAIGKLPVSLSLADTASFAPHKFYGLNGCGVLYKRDGMVLEPLIHGGASTTIYRSGTPDAAMAIACAESLELALSDLDRRVARVTELNGYLRKLLSNIPEVRINSPENAIPHIFNLSVSGIKAVQMQQSLDGRGICVSTKSACSVPNTPSRAVYAVTHDRKNALSSWRVSISHLTTKQELETLAEAIKSIIMEKTESK